MPLNGTLCKTLCDIFRMPPSPNVHWHDAETLLRALGSRVSPTKSGMRSDFGGGFIWMSHRPHPKPVMDKAATRDLKTHLSLAGHVPTDHGCRCH